MGAGTLGKERSTVGSASATGSVGEARTETSDDHMDDMDTSSTGGFSEEGNASLVGFGEGESSTVSGPVSSTPGRYQAKGGYAGQGRDTTPRTSGMAPRESRIIDGPYDAGAMDRDMSGVSSQGRQ